ncbi:hypothetical protein GZL_00420 [Streptomyces sp. 769]|nr:hypothetical protein GZL_00420 [Streptomyces sp. 769]
MELRDAYDHTGQRTDFGRRLTRPRETHRRLPGLIRHNLR